MPFTVAATPVVHVILSSSRYTATPAAAASYRHYDDERTTFFTPVSYQDTIFAAADFFQNDSMTVPAFDITPLRISMLLFMLGSLHLAAMILYADFKLPAKAVKCLTHAFLSVSILPPLLIPLHPILTILLRDLRCSGH